jgi:hypothetical protein
MRYNSPKVTIQPKHEQLTDPEELSAFLEIGNSYSPNLGVNY